MRVRRKTAIAVCTLVLLLLVAGAAALLLRPERIRVLLLTRIRANIAQGWTAELDAARWSFDDGLVAEGFRLREPGTRRVIVDVPRLRAGTRLWALVREGRVTDVRVDDPQVLLERRADGTFPLFEAFVMDPAAPDPADGGLPRIRIRGGALRLVDPAALAEDEMLDLAIRTIEIQEAGPGRPSVIDAEFDERGSPARDREGALGRVVVTGIFPPRGRGLRLEVPRLVLGPPLLERLSPDLQEAFDVLAVDGVLGDDEGGLPGLEVVFQQAPGAGAPQLAVTLRPRGLDVVIEGFPALLSEVEGEVRWSGSTLELGELRGRRGAATIALRGTLDLTDPDHPVGELRFGGRELYLDEGLYRSVPPVARRVWDAYGLGGTLDLTRAGPDDPISLDGYVRFDGDWTPQRLLLPISLRDGVLSYRGYEDEETGERLGFDYPVVGVTGEVDVEVVPESVRVVLNDIVGHHGNVQVRANGDVTDYNDGGASVTVNGWADDLPLDDDVRKASANMERLFERWTPTGTIRRLHVLVRQDADFDDGAYESITLHLDGRAGFTYDAFPLPVTDAAGSIYVEKVRVDGTVVPETRLEGVTARVDDTALTIDGTIEGADPARLQLLVTAQDLVMDGPVEAALRATPGARGTVAVWDALVPTGLADARVDITGTEDAMREVVRIRMTDAGIRGWNDVVIPSSGLRGTIDVSPEEIRIRDVIGETEDGAIAIDGVIHDPGGAVELDLTVEAADFPMDEDQRARLGTAGERAAGFFDFVRPAPGLRGNAHVRLTGPVEALDVAVRVDDIRGGVRPLGLRNLDLGGGTATYADQRIVVEDLEASMAGRELFIDRADLDLGTGSGELGIVVRRLRFPQDLVGVIPPETADAIAAVTPDRFFHMESLRVRMDRDFRRLVLDGTLSLSPRRVGATGGLGIEGVFGLEGLTFERMADDADVVHMGGRVRITRGVVEPGVRVERITGILDLTGRLWRGRGTIRGDLSEAGMVLKDRRLDGASGILELEDGVFRMREFGGEFARGELTVSATVGEEKPVYRANIALANARARELISPRDPRSDVRGRVDATLSLRNPTGRFADLHGEGHIDLRQGALFEVPLFKEIFRLLPGTDTPVFESGHMDFDLRRDKLSIQDLLLDSAPLALHKAVGGSRVWTDGRLDVSLRPEIKVLDVIGIKQVLQLIGLVTTPIYERIHKIHVGGTLDTPVVTNPLLPGIFAQSDDPNRLVLVAPDPVTEVRVRPVWDF